MAAEAAARCRGARESVADRRTARDYGIGGEALPCLLPRTYVLSVVYLVWQVALSRGATAWCLIAAPSPRRVSGFHGSCPQDRRR